MHGASSDQAFLQKLREIVLANMADELFGVGELARQAGISRSVLHRRLHTLQDKNISQFIREIRLERAQRLLQDHSGNVSEVAYAVGFSSPAYFSKCFHEQFGYPPGDTFRQPLPAEEPGSPMAAPRPFRLPLRRRSVKILVPGVLVLLAATAVWVFKDSPLSPAFLRGRLASHQQNISLMVLPFKNLSVDPGNQYFADGIGEDILNHLCQITGLKVTSRTSAEQFRETSLSAPEIARKMRVRYVLEGSVRRQDERIRVSVQLIDARQDQHLWSEYYDRQMEDVFAIQSDIALNVARELQFILTSAERRKIDKVPTVSTEAYNYYLLGRFYWNKRTEEDLKKSVEYFEKSIALDPDYAQAYAGLADAYFIQTWWMWDQRPAGFEKAKQTVIRALELDHDLAEAYATLGGILCNHDWDWEESRKMFRKAIQINPNYATAHQYYAELLSVLGERELSRTHIDWAVELDPLVFMHQAVRAGSYYRAGHYEEALQAFSKLEELNPDHHTTKPYCFLIHFIQGDHLKAMETLEEIMGRDTTTREYVDSVRQVYNSSGMKGLLHLLIDLELGKVFPNAYDIARWYAHMEEKEEALTWLEKAFEERIPAVPRIVNDANFEILREEPRFLALTEKMGLTPYMAWGAE
jgi:TolB-like protein/AraC-like DNA-binding protein/Tfp pilus assembly protein PilF